ncbi:MAG: M48 family metallopeptidase [Synergistaceae bacterium]
MKKIFYFILVLLFLQANPCISYSRELLDVSVKTIPKEKKMGIKSAKEIEKQIPRVLDPDKEAKLTGIMNKLIPYLKRNLDYEVRIIEMKVPNAFSLPGGITYFTTGMLDFLKSEDEFAAIMAHELVHADRAHVLVQMKRDSKLNLITLAGIIAATQGAGAPALLMSGAFQTALSNKYSIELEKEADYLGIDILHRAGYNPSAMLTMMERFSSERLKKSFVDPGIYQTHPEDNERIEAAVKYMRDNKIVINRKDALNKLKVEVKEAPLYVEISIDKHVLMIINRDAYNKDTIERFVEKLDKNLELELAPYDIQINTFDGIKRLYLRGEFILSENELTSGMPTLNEIARRINKIINDIRLDSPLTNYYN